MCSISCVWSPANCDCCESLKNEIIQKLWDNVNESDKKVLDKVFDYIKDIPKNYPKLAIRKNWEHYLVHFVETTRILLDISNELTLEQITIALLHDAIEDVEEIGINELTRLFWYDIASSVERLSKKNISKEWLSEEEYEKLKAKRNIEYFESLKNLSNRELDVKFSDRIHNLRTLKWLKRSFIERTLDETIKYFVPLAKERNKKAYNLMMQEIVNIICYLNKEEFNWIIFNAWPLLDK